jgi:predicted AlkP superfamily pyrophosphatase or phosphodiesterase
MTFPRKLPRAAMSRGRNQSGQVKLATARLFLAMTITGTLGARSVLPAWASQATAGHKTDHPPTPASVILITVDTLRADHLACYGRRRVKTPFFDDLASDGIIFEQAIPRVPLTLPSHCTISTGITPATRGFATMPGSR